MKFSHVATVSLLSVLSAFVLGGCAAGPRASGAASYALGSITGRAHGGSGPVIGATVKLYATQSVASPSSSNGYGYGQPGLLLAEADSIDGQQGDGNDTDSNGYFTLSEANYASSCPAGQQVYITVSGGHTGGNATNNNLLLMTALGSCSDLYDLSATGKAYQSSSPVWVNEVTTVAAAYALGHFMTVSGTSHPFTVNISAPANNNACDGSDAGCRGSVSFSNGVTTATANGLYHAFLNAENLVDTTVGIARTLVGSGVYGAAGTVPAAEMNALGNAVQSCVNSTGGSGSETPCGILFLNTPTIAGAHPTNTLSAIVNLAENPYSSAAAVNNIFGLQTSQANYYQPTLTSAPPDWTLSVVYTGGSLNTPYNLTLDANDQVYLTNIGTAQNIVSITSNGTFASGVNGWAFSDGTNTYTAPRGIAADSAGNIWVTNDVGAAVTPGSGVVEFSNSGVYENAYLHPTPIADAYQVAVDKRNDVWFIYATYGVGNVDYLQCTGTPCTYAYAPKTYGSFTNGAFTSNTLAAPNGISIDAQQNVWEAINSNNATGANEVITVVNEKSANQATAPIYNNGLAANATYPYPKIYTSMTNCAQNNANIVFDAQGNAYVSTQNVDYQNAVCEVIPGSYLGPFSTATPGPSPTYMAAPGAVIQGISMDGNGTIWIANFYANGGTSTYAGAPAYANFGISAFTTGNSATQLPQPTQGFTSCYVTGTTCALGSSTSAVSTGLAISNPRFLEVDSTGSIWATNPANEAITQTIGTAAPTWPLLASGKWGMIPY